MNKVQFYKACSKGNMKAAKALIKNGISCKDENGYNFLESACANGNLELVVYLLTSDELIKHADINYKDEDGNNCLQYACANGNLDIVKYLIENTVIDINEKNKDGDNCLINSCKSYNSEIVNYLLLNTNMIIDEKLIESLNKNDLEDEYNEYYFKDAIKIIEIKNLKTKLESNLNKEKIITKRLKI